MDAQEITDKQTLLRDTYIQTLQDKYSNGELYLSYSSLSKFRQSPKHFIDYKLKVDQDTDSLLLGRAVHCLVLEPEKFEKEYAIAPECDRRTKDGKAIYAEFLENSKDKITITNTLYHNAVTMANALLTNESSKRFIEATTSREKRIDWEMYGFKFLSFLDGEGEDFIFDIKTVPDADPKKTQREILNRNYWLQAGMYLEALTEVKDYYILAVDKSGNVSVHLLLDSLVEYGKNEFRLLCGDFEDCLSTNSWNKSYDYRTRNGFYPIDKPPYNI